MRLPFRNYLSTPLTVSIEPWCDEYEVPVGGTAVVNLKDGQPHSVDIHPDQFVTVWAEGMDKVIVEISDSHQF